MAIKINELLTTIGPGARTNKYRVHMPFFGRDFDIQCHEVSSPGRAMGVVDIYLRGREFKIAGDRGEASSLQVSFYNDPKLIIRNFFLRYIESIQGFTTPVSIEESLLFSETTVNFLRDGYHRVSDYVTEAKHNISSVLSSEIDFFNGTNWYQVDFTIQQLDEDENISSEMILHNAWISEVSDVQYTDEGGDVSKTSLTIVYTGSTIIDSM